MSELTAKGASIILPDDDSDPPVGTLCKSELDGYGPVRNEIRHGEETRFEIDACWCCDAEGSPAISWAIRQFPPIPVAVAVADSRRRRRRRFLSFPAADLAPK